MKPAEKPVPLIVPSLSEAQTYFIFRENGLEIRFSIDWRGWIYTFGEHLRIEEREYIKEKLIAHEARERESLRAETQQRD